MVECTNFVVAVSVAMRRWGAPAWRLEDDAARLSAALGLRVGIHVLPTSILVSEPTGTRVLSVRAGAPALDRTDAAVQLVDAVVAGSLRPYEALAHLSALEAAPARYPGWARVAAGGASSSAAAVLLGGGIPEVGVAAGIGLLTGCVPVALRGSPERARLADPAAAFLAGLVVAAWPGPLAGEISLLAGLIAFLPGFSLTTALIELATGHLVSGATGLVASGVALMQLGLGAAVGSRLAQLALGPANAASAVPIPELVPLAMGVASLGFAVLLSVPGRWVPAVGLAVGAALSGEWLGGWALGPGLGAGVGALAVALAASLVTRATGHPLALVQTPGLLILVPGAIGFRAVQDLIRGDLDAGVAGLTGTALAAMALVGGSLVGAALLPARRSDPVRATLSCRGGEDANGGLAVCAGGVRGETL